LASLTVVLGLLGVNSVMLASTVFAATPTSSGSLNLGSLNLGSLGLGSHWQSTGTYRFTLPQEVCQTLPALCQPGTQIFEIPSGVLTLGMPTPQAPGHTRSHVTLPSTGCVLGIIGSCGQATPTPKPKVTAAPTVKPTVAAVTTSPAPHPTLSAPAATPTPVAASSCLLGLGLLCPPSNVSNTSTGAATPTPAPTADSGLCILICSVLKIGGSNGCVATLLSACVVGPTASSGSGSGSGSAGANPGACVGNLVCLLGSSCTASLGQTCLLGAILPGLPGSSGSPNDPTAPGASSGNGSAPGSGSAPESGSTLTGTTTTAGPTFFGTFPTGASVTSGNTNPPPTPPAPSPRRDETVGLVSGLSFGHGLILWPLFGLLDLAALAGLVVVVRRRWTATTN
jgi:hypothetical protein